MREFIIWSVCAVCLVASVAIDWRAAGLMFIAVWANNLLRERP